MVAHLLCAATPLPIGEGLGVGLFCHSPTICHHLYIFETQWFQKIGGRVAAKTKKIKKIGITGKKTAINLF